MGVCAWCVGVCVCGERVWVCVCGEHGCECWWVSVCVVSVCGGCGCVVSVCVLGVTLYWYKEIPLL